MATRSPGATLTEANRAAQARQAALTAALVAYYYRTRVNVENPSSVESWLALVVPRILADREKSSRLSAVYGDALRRIDAPKATGDGFKFDPTAGPLDASVVRSSLMAVGVQPVQTKMHLIRDDAFRAEQGLSPLDAGSKQALINEANKTAFNSVAGATARHVQNGGRAVLLDGVARDKVALGYVRVTKDNPCYFCAMLASRGLVYAKDSFDESDPRFTNGKTPSTVKVHDSCGCGLRPAYNRSDEILAQSKTYEEMWKEASYKPGFEAVREFRRLYEGTGQYKTA